MSADAPECINIYKNVAGMWQGRGRGDMMLQEDPATTPPEDNKQQLLQPTATSCNAPWRKGGSQLERIRIFSH